MRAVQKHWLRSYKIWVFLAGGLVGIVFLAYGIENWRGARAWKEVEDLVWIYALPDSDGASEAK